MYERELWIFRTTNGDGKRVWLLGTQYGEKQMRGQPKHSCEHLKQRWIQQQRSKIKVTRVLVYQGLHRPAEVAMTWADSVGANKEKCREQTPT